MLFRSQQLAALSRDVSDSVEARFRGDRQAVFAMARQLVQAQFVEGNGELARRLWDDVAERGLDVDRVIHLMYRCIFIDDDAAMLEADEAYAASR